MRVIALTCSSRRHKDRMESLDRLIENNNGLFKSDQQKRHFENESVPVPPGRDYATVIVDQSKVRVPLEPGQFVVTVLAEPADKTLAETIQQSFVIGYLCDQSGVLRKFVAVEDWKTGETSQDVVWERSA